MVTEIELKAHVPDSQALKQLLLKKAEYLGSFEKDDSYWLPGATTPVTLALPPSGLRIRREKQLMPDASEECRVVASFKSKEIKDGIEVNEEREFELRPGGETANFEEFLRRMGLKEGFSKKKRGWVFSHEGINAELVEVEGLGYFVELEILMDEANAANGREESIAGAKKRLLDFLDSLGIERAAIESRFYSEMLGARPVPHGT